MSIKSAPAVLPTLPALANRGPGEFSDALESDFQSELQSTKKKLFSHLPFLDGLRALSIFAVLTFHSGGPIGTYIFKKGGWVGVDAFFVISGFLITAILLKEQDRSGTIGLKNFYMRRALRLMPAFSLWIIVTSILRIINHKFSLASAGIAAVYMCDYDLALGWGNILGSGFEIAWSLSVEEKFYLIWPSIVKRCRQYLPYVGIAAIVGCFLWRTYLIVHNAPWVRICGAFDTKIDALMIGCVAAMMLNHQPLKLWLEKHLRTSIISCVLLVFIVFYIRGIGHPGGAHGIKEQLIYWNLRLPIFTFSIAALIVSLCAYPQALAARLLSWAPIAWVGRVSYSLYLWHMAAFACGVWAIWAVYSTFPQLRPLGAGEVELVQYSSALLLAAVSFYFVESPFLKMKDRLSVNAKSANSGQSVGPSKRLARHPELVSVAREKGR